MIPKPNRDFPIGEMFMHGAERFEVVKRPPIRKAIDACSGCDMSQEPQCTQYACSCFDRKDRTSVWFKRVTKLER